MDSLAPGSTTEPHIPVLGNRSLMWLLVTVLLVEVVFGAIYCIAKCINGDGPASSAKVKPLPPSSGVKDHSMEETGATETSSGCLREGIREGNCGHA
ncbi:hypothetical protein M5689_023297 [Euphorbia peplus]|nr:hypothetical protein M5689_023297 [Euphorbia peplus]